MGTISIETSIEVTIRRATPADKPEWVRMRQGVWPEAPLDYLNYDLDDILADARRAVFIAARAGGKVIGFVEASLREYGEGCETSPVGYIESWFVDEDLRGQGIGGMLVHTAENWARERGCTEMGSDTWLENQVSIEAHKKLGYEEAECLIHFVKKL
jgi:aminoglycoside 6'-N-acetyltransferase I